MPLISNRKWSFLLVLIAQSMVNCAESADLFDSSFGEGGIFIRDIGQSERADSAYSVALQPDGKVVVAGWLEDGADIYLTRLMQNGQVDMEFGQNGITRSNLGGVDMVRNVIVLPDGKLLALASTTVDDLNYGAVLLRYDSKGTLDSSYVTSGINRLDFAGHLLSGFFTCQLAVQADNKTVVSCPTQSGHTALMRIAENGSRDQTFGHNGVAIISDFVGGAVVIADDGDLLLGGNRGNRYALARLTSTGDLDSSFAGQGVSVFRAEQVNLEPGYLLSIALQPNGAVVWVGREKLLSSPVGTLEQAVIGRVNANGVVDKTFGDLGMVHLPLAELSSLASSVEIQSDGKIVAAGHAQSELFHVAMATVRLHANGALDTEFGNAGTLLTRLYGEESSNSIDDFALDSFGNIVVAGQTLDLANTSSAGNQVDTAVVRYKSAAIDLSPDEFLPSQKRDVALNSWIESDTVEVAGLSVGSKVPAHVKNGEFRINDELFGSAKRWVENGDRLTLRHQTSANTSTAHTTTIYLGGLYPSNNASLALGYQTEFTFTSTTVASALPSDPPPANPNTGSASGGGAFTHWFIVLLLPAFAIARARVPHHLCRTCRAR